MKNPPAFLERPAGARLAYVRHRGRGPGVMFLGGFKSDMTGTKAMALDAYCRRAGRAYLRFDYSGHGRSSGRFEDGTIGIWRDDALAILDALSEGPQILVGSSMGGWIALLAALARPQRIAGLVLVAPAPDFTQWGIAQYLSAEDRAALERDGHIARPSDYGDAPYVYTHALIEDGMRHGLLDAGIGIDAPVRILHGLRDDAVPWRISIALCERLASEDVVLSLVKSGDHRLSRDADIDRLIAAVEEVAGHAG